ncbi:MAG: biopolymer transporter ExbD [Candidatus Amulumruptor caecigallinarius]|uniref:Biopolymer transporter ExbD n=1 Tax=Candidatus Amulumruptor caecigallinarius TaxID=2109911 RepID=A0A4Q0UAR1_9BACT|nr:MAG: biopolymer transporter ExbD [Candidatus Amulumruptor caecigallinarius]HJE39625.1 biopolymer transporter ExbD [Candidatus Amulumruptor caecigallinarius]
MGKVKIKRKSTLIDMTAMSDVTVLLLTFFMLTSTFLQKEPVTVMTPSSVSEEKVPTSNLASILVSPEGKVFISVAGEADLINNDPSWGTEEMRKSIIREAVSEYNRLHPSKKVELTEADILTFSKINMFGVPFSYLHEFLSKSQLEQDQIIGDMSNPRVGIPIDDNKDMTKPNEFQIWMRAIRNSGNENIANAMKKGEGIAVKADRNTPYEIVHHVLDNLQSLKMNRFALMTALKTEQD